MATDRTDDPNHDITDLPGSGEGERPDEPLHSDEGELTPPHGDDLRGEETFGRTDRYSNLDDETASRERQMERIDDREADNARMDVRRRENSAR